MGTKAARVLARSSGFRLGLNWPTCSETCTGARLDAQSPCLAHLKIDELTALLERWKEGSKLDARGVTITPPLFDRVWRAATVTPNGRRMLTNIDLSNATFDGDTWFTGATLAGDFSFREAIFNGQADFSGVEFDGETTDFIGAQFSKAVDFGDACFKGFSRFENVRFGGPAYFNSAVFRDQAFFTECSFEGHASFDLSRFDTSATFNSCTFETACDLGRMLVLAGISLRDAIFTQSVRLMISAPWLDCTGSQFRNGVQLGVRFGEVACGNCGFNGPSIISSFPQIFVVNPDTESQLRQCDITRKLEFTEQPRVLCLRSANVENLVLSGVDLRGCRFEGAHNLDKLRIGGNTLLARSLRGWSPRRPWPPRKYWTRRRTIAEEHEWRDLQHQLSPAISDNNHRGRQQTSNERECWYEGTPSQSPNLLAFANFPLSPLKAGDIAGLYRALRKGLEDNKDASGAGDFYYGEMEMRRHDRESPLSERLIVWFYWLVSGYGVRTSRALISLLVTILVFAPLFHWWGFADGARSVMDTVLFTAGSTTSLFHAPARELTYLGQTLDMGLRLLGPLFFGLALLSLRARVHR